MLGILSLLDRGRMKVTHHPAGSFKPILPQDLSGKDCLGGDKGSTFCFKAGRYYIASDRL